MNATSDHLPRGVEPPPEIALLSFTNRPVVWMEADRPAVGNLLQMERGTASGKRAGHIGEDRQQNSVRGFYSMAVYKFPISKAGTYDLFIRYSDDGGNDQIAVVLDEHPGPDFNTEDTLPEGRRSGKGWNHFVWGKVMAVMLSKGEHELSLKSISSYYGADLDGILLVGQAP